ncbi:MAG: hypothetical protein ACLPHP_17975 [Candidatus Sulfotelmatobacter sp.]
MTGLWKSEVVEERRFSAASRAHRRRASAPAMQVKNHFRPKTARRDMDNSNRAAGEFTDEGKRMLLVFDPVEDSFVLAQHVKEGLQTIGVLGDAVGFFICR